jgi:hypothetical protein
MTSDESFHGETVPPALPTSDLLIRIVENCPDGPISIGDLIDGLGDRAFGILFLMLTLPTAVPGPPGMPTAFGIPLLIFTAQLALRYDRPWMPEFIRRRRFSRNALLGVLRRVRPALARLESICRPRMLRLTERKGECRLGAFFFLCTIVLVNPIPIPFSHLPLAIALVVLSLGYVERDGIVIVSGIAASLIGIVINISMLGGVFVLIAKFLHLG